mmetsp:Transcript_101635/g.270314  ORF Transcript_101635/g.270314 Transcript_101635/m.270314 type:complete len:174 (-) Transcript_101635:19-540(-)|eukprot:CAMPEP_0171215028 /NCGR_PEP_ID=MMETSP0790-20130122/31458_1 /TAXON_ID=2925 /ORGANISM="Alexandrium catenella, Strain OF101" /LENGTH=173 /DNA_ID=CAMNT_0011680773 /DNA_START=61 /DNA_END=582 /DNA_ORIENTATION=-
MDVKLVPGAALSKEQAACLLKAFGYVASTNPLYRKRKSAGDTQMILKTELPRLLRGVGKTPTNEELGELMDLVPEEKEELDFECFVRIFYRASQTKTMNEGELFEHLKALDLSGTATLDPKAFKDIMSNLGDGTPPSDIDKILEGLPRNRLGRVSCRLIARRLAGGPDGIQHV